MVDKRESYTKEDLLASGRGELFGAKGPQLPAPNMLMMDRVVKMTETGGNPRASWIFFIPQKSGIMIRGITRKDNDSRLRTPEARITPVLSYHCFLLRVS